MECTNTPEEEEEEDEEEEEKEEGWMRGGGFVIGDTIGESESWWAEEEEGMGDSDPDSSGFDFPFWAPIPL